ncbi:MAG: ribonuclease HII [Acidobacteria bacterium]|nr:ribonuclease HII [Acidobacteriota bacterium]
MTRSNLPSGNLRLFVEESASDADRSGSFELGRLESLSGPGQHFPTPPRYILNKFRLNKLRQKNHRNGCTRWFEKQAAIAGFERPAGADEAGRGALFGPVMAAAVILNPSLRIKGINDSKQLTAARREELEAQIKATALSWSVAEVDAGEIDRINVYQASRVAMRQAVLTLHPEPDFVFVDALRLDLMTPQLSLIHGDALCLSIAAASILAKVERDRRMQEYERIFPGYNLGQNKGYGTAEHCAALRNLGATRQHRRSYAPVAAVAAAKPKASESLF